MVARTYGGVKITNEPGDMTWDDAVQSTALPLTDAGAKRITWNAVSDTWDFYIGGLKVAELTVDGNLRIKGEVMEGQIF